MHGELASEFTTMLEESFASDLTSIVEEGLASDSTPIVDEGLDSETMVAKGLALWSARAAADAVAADTAVAEKKGEEVGERRERKG